MSAPNPQGDDQLKYTREEICRLPHSERMRYVEQMRVRYPLWEKISAEIERCHHMKAMAAEPQCMLLVGPTGAGKTTLAASYTLKYPAVLTETVTLRPVVMATTPATASIKNLMIALLGALGDPAATKGTIGAMEYRLIRYFKEACMVELLILDELQHFVDRDSQRILLNASNWLKTFIKETRVSCILIGLQDEAEEVVDSNPQLFRLFGDPYILAPFEWDETRPDDTREVFRNFLRELEKLLPLKEPCYLADYETALRCFAASDGIVSYIMALVRSATQLALEQKRECLDSSLLPRAFQERLAPKRRGIPNPFNGAYPTSKRSKRGELRQKKKETEKEIEEAPIGVVNLADPMILLKKGSRIFCEYK